MVQSRLWVLFLMIIFKRKFSLGNDSLKKNPHRRITRSSNNICKNEISSPNKAAFDEIFYCGPDFCCRLQEWRPIEKYCHICNDNTFCCPQIYCCSEGDASSDKLNAAALQKSTTEATEADAMRESSRIGSYYVYVVLGIGAVLVSVIILNECTIAKKRSRRNRVHAENIVIGERSSEEDQFERMGPLPGFYDDYFSQNAVCQERQNFQERRVLTPPPPYAP